MVGHDFRRQLILINCRRHPAVRARAGNQHVLAEQVELQGRVHGVAEGVEDGRDVEVDAGPVFPHVRHRQQDVLRARDRITSTFGRR